MVSMTIRYDGELRCSARHGPSGSEIETDAPVDNHGRAERFSPTDLMGVSLATCAATVLGILASRRGWDLRGMRIDVQKEMSATPPRCVVRLPVQITLPCTLPAEDRALLEETARGCPVARSIHPSIEAPMTFHWPA
jgi:uncharacterized OsmC-like protein